MNTRIIAFVNLKGGVAKTTSCINIGAGLSKMGKRVLLIDLDPQANLTYSLGIQGHELNTTIVEVLQQKIEARQSLVKVNDYYIIPSKLDLADMERFMNAKATGREFFLKKTMKELISHFDYILLDCPPSASILTYNALAFANEVYIPVQCEFLSLHGLVKIIATLEEIKEDNINNDIEITGIFGTMYQGISKLHQEVLQQLRDSYKSKVFNTAIRRSVSLAEAQANNNDIFNFQLNSNGTADYYNLCLEIIKQEESKKVGIL